MVEASVSDGDIEQTIAARPRDLGGFHVGRVLPALRKRCVGPFVFFDHMGPEADAELAVRPHPHLHLATVTYLFAGEVHHRDSLGTHQVIRPGAINWMTAGRGIVHSERSQRRMAMHGLQLWVGLPRAHEDSAPAFDHYPADTLPQVGESGAQVRVLAGTVHGVTSPVRTLSPLFYADVQLAAGARFALPDGYRERAAYVIDGAVTSGSERLERGRMAVFTPGTTPTLAADGPARMLVLGGDPLDGPRYIWWNFVSSDKQRIVDAAHAWRARRFATIPGDDQEFIPAPAEDPHFASGYRPPTDDEMRALLMDARTIAMVGASNNPERPSHGIMKILLDAGYRVIPVNPKEATVLGQPAVPSLSAIAEPVDIVDVFRKPEDTPAIADEAVAIGAKALWLQLGVTSDDAAARAQAGGLQVVMDRCIGATYRRLQIPGGRGR
jgi:redox-sensitive bicupin YhaK (pirin superfamily)/predicted CoA-binding protein